MSVTHTTIKIHDTVERVSVNSLKANPYNPNRMTTLEKRSLEHGIRTEGFIDPIHAQKDTGVIIDGEHRWKIAKALGMKKIPVIFLAVTDAQARKLTLAFINRKGSAKQAEVALLLQDIQELSKTTLKTLEMETAIARKELKEMLIKVDTDTNAVEGLVRRATKKAKSSPAKENGKVSADPIEPDEDFKESPVEDESFAEMHQFPVTFFVPTIEDRELIKALCGDKYGELSYTNLKKVVDYYLKKHPKKAAKVLAAVASE